MKIFTGNANKMLGSEICDYLGINPGSIDVGRFNDGEVMVKINEDVRGQDVFILQPTCAPVNENIMELLIMIDAFARASAERITAVIPYFGYARQDRKDQGRVPISAKLIANLLAGSGVNRMLAMDLHAGQIQGFFDIPVDHLYSNPVFIGFFKGKNFTENKNLVVVTPDVGGIKMARAFAKNLECPLAIVDKRRVSADTAHVMNIIGDVRGRNVIIVDDIIATAGSVQEAALALKENGAEKIFVAATHAVLADPAIERLDASPIEKIFVTNTIPISKEKMIDKINVLSVAPVLGEAIRRIHNKESVSSLFY